MFGFLAMLGLVGLQSAKDSVKDHCNREVAKRNGDKYYFDHKSRERATETGERVSWDNFSGNITGVETGRVYGNPKRERALKEIAQWNKELEEKGADWHYEYFPEFETNKRIQTVWAVDNENGRPFDLFRYVKFVEYPGGVRCVECERRDKPFVR